MPVSRKLLFFLLAFTALRLGVSGSFELALDEGYYWLWSRHLSLGYYDHPPMVALVIAFTTLVGESELFVRLGAVIGSVAASLLVFRLADNLFENMAAGWHAVWLLNISLIFSVGALVVSPDTPLVPIYLAALLLFREAAEKGGAGRWLLAGAVAGLALLSKYTAAFFFPCAFMYLLLSPGKRRWLATPMPYLATLVSAAVFSPVIIWNWQHGWMSFAFQSAHGLARAVENPAGHLLEFVGFQAVLYSVGIFFFLMAAGVALVRGSFFNGADESRRDVSLFLFSFSVPVLAFFALNSLRATVEGNWPVLGFLPLIVQAGGMAEGWLASARARTALIASAAAAFLFLVFLHVQVVDPVIPHPKRFEISRRIYGWRLLATAVDVERKSFPAAFLIADRFQTGTLMTYYTAPHIPAYQIGGDNPRRYSFLPPVDSYAGSGAIYLAEESRDASQALAPVFERVEKVRTVEITRKGELIRRFVLYRCYNYRGGLDLIHE
ncbi:MAG: glycosyltransferase family 39 protein [Nitrospinae bacterium]|nr:glycosyltransferase family 39 protein [Nitrospinota bacterium]